MIEFNSTPSTDEPFPDPPKKEAEPEEKKKPRKTRTKKGDETFKKGEFKLLVEGLAMPFESLRPVTEDEKTEVDRRATNLANKHIGASEYQEEISFVSVLIQVFGTRLLELVYVKAKFKHEIEMERIKQENLSNESN